MRLDLHVMNQFVTYMTWPNLLEDRTLVYQLHSSRYVTLYQEGGWTSVSARAPGLPNLTWGWGAKSRIRDWRNEIYKTIVLGSHIIRALGGSGVGHGIWLSPDSLDSGIKTSQTTLLHRVEGINLEDFLFY